MSTTHLCRLRGCGPQKQAGWLLIGASACSACEARHGYLRLDIPAGRKEVAVSWCPWRYTLKQFRYCADIVLESLA
ncbi:hypothetical protein BR93DRAFT_478399 [Coniochaeta sp. PMI_546]|nr:hypothetical protein BR93DRAFT_478399 [Coniochaeta sp. PMI_546]